MMKLKVIGLVLLWLGASVTPALVKTLPQGVWKMDVYQNMYEIEKAGVNPSGDKVTWSEKNLKDATMSDIYMLTYINNLIIATNTAYSTDYATLDLTTQLANSWTKDKLHFDIAYGLTDKLTLFANSSYEVAELDYTDEYVLESQKMDIFLTSVGRDYDRVPDKATSSHMNDIYLGFKYNLSKFSIAYKFTSGDLTTGIDAREKDVSDGVQELETSKGYDQHYVYLFMDTPVMSQTLHWTFAHAMFGNGYQDFLDNKAIDISVGNMYIAKCLLPYSFTPKITLNTDITYIVHETDQYKGGNSESVESSTGYTEWTDVPDSEGSTVFGNVELVYQPKIFLKTFVKANMLLHNDYSGQLYGFPGRIVPGTMISFGATLFYK